MDSEKKRSDEYWMGVRDALRMVDSFNKWAQRNKERAKDLDDFIHDGLIAAAKRCESCLKDDLGLTFLEGEDSPIDEPVPSGYEATSPLSEEVEAPPLLEISHESPEEELIHQTDVDISTKSLGRSDDEDLKDISHDGPVREFTSDFELVEPLPLVVEPSAPEIDVERKPSFSWTEYEEAVTPTKEDPVIEKVEEEEDAPVMESELAEADSIPKDEPVSFEPSKPLDPSEEPALPTDEFEGSFEEDGPPSADLDDPEVTDTPEPITEPPSPPPPPESDEDEDERRRRARRLFFGD
ncbi:MAG: hypothetical protein E3J86_01290 [Candidatus Thorarchaeota archaeon]|nr:MAG: hypothetical protein E3J86_01290 [Candidatus Thorarchaeota archaeon]